MLEGTQNLHKEYKLKEEASALIKNKIEKRKAILFPRSSKKTTQRLGYDTF